MEEEDIILRIGSPTINILPERRESIMDLAGHIARIGRSVAIEEQERIPGRYGLPWAENVAIYIGAGIGSGLIGAIVTDVYNISKKWARERFRQKQEAQPGVRVRSERVVIYGPDGKVVCVILIDEHGEHERYSLE